MLTKQVFAQSALKGRHHMSRRMMFALAALIGIAAPAAAQQPAPSENGPANTTAAPETTKVAASSAGALLLQPLTIQHFRPADARGLYMFEAPKNDNIPYTGFRLAWGAAFTQQFQGLSHSNTAAPNMVSGVNSH